MSKRLHDDRSIPVEDFALAASQPSSLEFYSCGYACSILGVLPHELRELAREAGVEWAFINDTLHLDPAGLAAIDRKLRET